MAAIFARKLVVSVQHHMAKAGEHLSASALDLMIAEDLSSWSD
jgi:hypothetical protein